ncbi:SurA N-terminal domain-containing protein [Phenylobacterium sp.]|jgi:EpsD family peptidyl-prolyl cis-trans isomerase|uniref:SurA N-terminal domain-containing protein n=1 Tax=Phenylobacterium sp. TaxID=1871053 RepID=UPI002F41C232
MKVKFAVAMAAVACVGLTACGNGQPKGQVVAKVGKEEVTALDLQSAMNGFQAPNAQVRKAAEQQVLAQIVQRKILAQAARKQKLDKTPEFARQQQQATEALLVRDWQEKLVKSVPAPNPDEVNTFIAQHPDLYSARKRFTVDVVRFPTPNDPTLAKALQPLHTLDEVRALLTSRKIPFGSNQTQIDALAVDPKFIEQIMKLKPDDVFIVPQPGGTVIAGHIVDTKVDPVGNDIAKRHATEYLRRTRVQETINRQFGSVVQQGLKDVKYAKGYEPVKRPAAKPGATPAAPAAAPAAGAPAAPAKTGG